MKSTKSPETSESLRIRQIERIVELETINKELLEAAKLAEPLIKDAVIRARLYVAIAKVEERE